MALLRLLLRVVCLCSALAVALPARPPSVTIGALFTFDSVIGSSAATAIQLAVDDINGDPTVLRGTNLSVLMQDTMCSGFVGTIQGNNLAAGLSFLLLFLPQINQGNKIILLPFLVLLLSPQSHALHAFTPHSDTRDYQLANYSFHSYYRLLQQQNRKLFYF